MARLINGILGNVSGVIGTVEGNSGKFGGILKARKKDSAQVVNSTLTPQREAYQKTLSIWRDIPPVWRNAFLFERGNQVSVWNRFVQLNLKNVKETIFPYWTNLNLSFSNLPYCDYNIVFQRSLKRFYVQRLTPVDGSIYFKPNDSVYFLLLDGFGRVIAYYYGWNRNASTFYVMAPWFSIGAYPFICMYVALANEDGTYFYHIVKEFQS